MVISTKDKTTEARSLIGRLHHTPSNPMNRGIISKQGIRKMIWRVRLRKIALWLKPMLWKNCVEVT